MLSSPANDKTMTATNTGQLVAMLAGEAEDLASIRDLLTPMCREVVVCGDAPDALVYGLTRALFNPVNQAGLAASHPAGRDIGLDSAARNPPAPIHPGAARYYREVGRLAR